MFNNLILYLKKFKSTLIWYYFLSYLIKPIFDFFWEFIINFQGKIYYYKWFLEKKSYFSLNNSDKVIVKNDQDNINLAKELSNIIDNKFQKKYIEVFNNNKTKYKNNEFEDYRIDLFKFLPDETKHKIINFALSKKNVSTAAKYLKVFPIIGKIYLFLNFPVPEKKERGAMLWHKDDFGYKSLDLFMAIEDIDDENGPFFFVNKKEPLGVFFKLKNILENATPGQRNKVELNKFSEKFSKDKISCFKAEQGDAIFVDSFTTYHRGGFCRSKNRLMLRICYQTPDSIDVQSKIHNDGFYFFSNIKKNNIKDKFHSYLLFKKINFLWKISNIPNILMMFYRLFHYKS